MGWLFLAHTKFLTFCMSGRSHWVCRGLLRARTDDVAREKHVLPWPRIKLRCKLRSEWVAFQNFQEFYTTVSSPICVLTVCEWKCTRKTDYNVTFPDLEKSVKDEEGKRWPEKDVKGLAYFF